MSRTWRLLLEIARTDTTFELAAAPGTDPADRRAPRVWVGKCLHCGSRLSLSERGEPLGSATVEHLLPRSAGGTDDLHNLAIACARCNHEKGVRHDHRPDDPRAREVREALQRARAARWRDPAS
jgi:5-methylcytosine-specific restriction endonuclease McrA